MDKILTYPSIVLGLIFIFLYVKKCYICKDRFHLPDMINIFLLGSGIYGGAILLLSSLFESLRQYISDFNLYIAISGITVFAVSCQGLFQHGLIKTPDKSSNNESSKEIIGDVVAN